MFLRVSLNWIDLPEDVTASILSRLEATEILSTAQRVCTTWRKICKDPRNWRTINMCDVSVYDKSPSQYRFNILCRQAIDLSCGNLVDISIHNFGSDDLLKHITDSNGLIRAASKLPLLEELELSYKSSIKE
ncbi:putative F-box/LRR-repeat protein 21 [Argentina anserina]|uniref:putative F-box/LRR-repeat protein 21 n=1 Tax=Argentina anserina TaxID=57926 RepID=UPI002176620C|nr:putative F-box/LRR-repeat protein 21 [Potentilla anserina]